jgi:hypothetical protein
MTSIVMSFIYHLSLIDDILRFLSQFSMLVDDLIRRWNIQEQIRCDLI